MFLGLVQEVRSQRAWPSRGAVINHYSKKEAQASSWWDLFHVDGDTMEACRETRRGEAHLREVLWEHVFDVADVLEHDHSVFVIEGRVASQHLVYENTNSPPENSPHFIACKCSLETMHAHPVYVHVEKGTTIREACKHCLMPYSPIQGQWRKQITRVFTNGLQVTKHAKGEGSHKHQQV